MGDSSANLAAFGILGGAQGRAAQCARPREGRLTCPYTQFKVWQLVWTQF